MISRLVKTGWLLVVCGLFNAAISMTFLIGLQRDGPVSFGSWRNAVILLGTLALAGGACTVAAGLQYTGSTRWFLMLNGVALSALGLIYRYFAGFRISFLTVALLIIVLAVSTGLLELKIAQSLGRVAGRWLFSVAGAVSAGFAVVFLLLGVGWIRLGPGSQADIFWLAAYFGFSAVCLLGTWSLPSQI